MNTSYYLRRDRRTAELFSDEFRENPYPTLKFLRENAPIFQSPYGIWIATRYEDVLSILKNKRLKRDFERTTADVYGDQALQDYTTSIMRHWIVNQNPPFHPKLRKYMTRAIGCGARELEPVVIKVANDLVDRGIASGDFDLVRDLTFPMTATVICEIVGVPPDERDMFVEKSIFPDPGLLDVIPLPPERRKDVTHRARIVMEYLEELCRRKLENPKHDFTSELLRIHTEEDPELTLDCIAANIFFMFFAGHQSTQNLLSNCLRTLYTHPEQLELLQAQPNLIDNAAEELVRYDTSVQTGHLYYALEDIVINGAELKQGDKILPLLSAANHDPEVNPEPELFDILRKKPKHLSFNAGTHFCIGARLAMMELRIMLKTLLKKLPNLQLSEPDNVEVIPTYTLRGIKSLPVRW